MIYNLTKWILSLIPSAWWIVFIAIDQTS